MSIVSTPIDYPFLFVPYIAVCDMMQLLHIETSPDFTVFNLGEGQSVISVDRTQAHRP
jgi:hypothetical protein